MPNGLLTPAELDAIQRTDAHIPAIARLLEHARMQHYQVQALEAERGTDLTGWLRERREVLRERRRKEVDGTLHEALFLGAILGFSMVLHHIEEHCPVARAGTGAES